MSFGYILLAYRANSTVDLQPTVSVFY